MGIARTTMTRMMIMTKGKETKMITIITETTRSMILTRTRILKKQ